MVPSPPSDDESTGDRSGDGSSGSAFSRHVARVTDRFDALFPFAAVPLALSILETEKLRRALDPAPGSFSINVEFAFPAPLLDLWTFVEAPPPEPEISGEPTIGPGGSGDPFDRGPTGPTGSGGSGGGGGTEVTIETPVETVVTSLEAIDAGMAGWIGTLLLAYAAIGTVVAAVYLGGIDRRLRGDPAAPIACVVRYAPPLLAYYLVTVAAFALVAPLLVVAPPLVVLAIPAVFVLGYLFYAVPFLIVVCDAEFLAAVRRSYGFAIEGGPYFGFAVHHVLVAAVTSLALSVAVSAGGVGVLVGLAVATALALVLTAATVSFVGELVGRDDRGDFDSKTVSRRSG